MKPSTKVATATPQSSRTRGSGKKNTVGATNLELADRLGLDSARTRQRNRPYMGGASPLDRQEFARFLRAARTFAEIDSTEEVARRVAELGFDITRHQVYAWERGESVPRFDQWMGLLLVLDPPNGFDFFRPCFRPDVWDRYREMVCRSE
jgi:hypothetical protein